MSSRGLGTVRDEALELTLAERAELARDPVASLDGATDANAAEDWDREVQRRLDEIEAGTATLIDRHDFSRRVRERLGRGPSLLARAERGRASCVITLFSRP